MSTEPTIPRAFSRRTALGLAAGLSLTAAGCVSVPTTGPVSPVTPSGSAIERGGGIDVRPPATGATPLTIVLGFLDAMASGGGGDLAKARLFLLPELQESWQPVGVIIFPTSANPAAKDDTVVLEASPVVGQLDQQSAFIRADPTLDHDFGMALDGDGQWRIGEPPTTLLISRALFQEFYRSYDRYFFEPSYRRLVPDPIFLPYTRGSSPLAGALVQSLLDGPTRFLSDSVVNLFPTGTQLTARSVVVTDRIADVELSDQVLGLAEPQRSLMAAQLSWTLSQAVDIDGLRINGGSLQLAGAVGEGSDAYLPVEVSQRYGPVPDGQPTLFGLDGDRMVVVDAAGNQAQTRPVPGGLGAGDYDLRSVAVSDDEEDVAVVTRADELFSGPLDGPVTRILTGRGALLRPQVVGDETWTVSQQDDVATLHVFRAGKAVAVDARALPPGRILAFRVAADGARLALIRELGDGSQLGLMPVARGDNTLVLGNWRAIDLIGADGVEAAVVTDVAWQGPTSLLVLAGADTRATIEPYAVSQDGYETERIGLSENWGARGLAASPAMNAPAVILGSSTRTFRFVSQSRWVLFSDRLRFLAYAG